MGDLVMRNVKVWGVFVMCLVVARVGAAADSFVSREKFDFERVIGKPPADDSPQHVAEVDQMLAIQEHRTAEEVKRCKAEEKVDPFIFREVLGEWFNPKDLPETTKLFTVVTNDATQVAGSAKDKYGRVRPPVADQRIHPCVRLEKTASYPSGHATRGVVWATLLAEIFPEKRDALMARGKLIGQDRVIGGMHYPSDVAAGQKLGAAIGKKLLEDEKFRARFEKVREECHAAAFVRQ